MSAFHLLVVREDCWAPFFVDFAWLSPAAWTAPASPLVDCVKASISKSLGYGIILGSSIVKLPQAANVWRARSGAGLSLDAQLLELVSNGLAVAFHATYNKSPFSAYGETIIVALGCLLVVGAMLNFAAPGARLAGGARLVAGLALVAALSADVLVPAVAAAGVSPAPSLKTLGKYVNYLSNLTFWFARGAQIYETALSQSNGAQSPITLFANLAGTVARIFTSMREVKDKDQLYCTIFNALLNAVLCVQWALIARKGAAGGRAAPRVAKAKAPKAAPAPAPKAAAPSPAKPRAKSAKKA